MGTGGVFTQQYSDLGMKLTTHLHLVWRLWMSGTIHLFTV